MSPTSRFAIPSALALAALLLMTASAVWQFGSPVQAAGLLWGNRGSNVHGLQTPGGAAPSMVGSPLPDCGASCSSSVVP